MEITLAVTEVNLWAVLTAAVVCFVIGGLWYGPLFGKAWMAAVNMTEEDAAKGNMPLIFGTTFVLQLIAALALALVAGSQSTLSSGLCLGLLVGIFWVATAFGTSYLFEQRCLKLWLINAGYNVVTFAAMGAIVGVWH